MTHTALTVTVSAADVEPVKALLDAASRLADACGVLELNPCNCGQCQRYTRALILAALADFRRQALGEKP